MKETVISPPSNTRHTKENSGAGKQFFPRGQEDSFFNAHGIQPKLNIGQRGDKYEQHADAMADKVVSKSANNTIVSQAKATHGDTGEKLNKKEEEQKNEAGTLQRKPMFESDGEPEVQKKENSGGSTEASPSIESSINSSKGSGSSLDNSTRSEMEGGFGNDFSGVRVHTGNEAQQMNKDLNAQAFTHGQDIYFDQGKYNPQTSSGKHLLAHELTHTVQQTGGVQKMIQKNGNAPAPAGGAKPGKGLIADGSIVGSDVILTKFPLKKYQFNSKTINAPTSMVTGIPILKVGTRKTNQDTAWKNMVKDDVKNSLDQRAKDAKFTKRIIIKRKGKPILPMGTPSELAERNELINPKWDILGNDVFNEIEHKVDALIAGNDDADKPENLMLLDHKTNRAIGGGHVPSLIKNSVDNVLEKDNNNSLKNKTFASLQKNGKVKIQSGINADIVHPTSVWEKSDFSKSKLKSDTNPLSKKYLEIVSGEVPAGSFILKTKKNALGYVLKFTEKNEYIELKPDDSKKPTKIDATIKQMFKKGKGKEPGVFKKISPIKKSLVQDATDGDVWVLNLPELTDTLHVNYLSPLIIDEDSGDFNPYSGLQAKGKVKSDIPLLRDVDISFEASGSNFTISAEIETDYLNNKFPKPFSVDYSTFSISASTTEGLSVGGEIGFGIEKVGKGNLKAGIGKDGFSLEGSFDFDPKLFKGKVSQAGIKAAYNKQDGWKIEGDLTFAENAVKGIKSGNIHVEYANDLLKAEGTAETTIKGVKEVTLKIVFGKDEFEIEGGVKIEKLPGIKEGDGTLKVVKKDNIYDFSGSGKITPDIPGLTTQLAFEFHNDIFLVDAKVDFEKGRLKGMLNVGITNRAVDAEGKPTGKALPDYKVYGESTLALQITDKITVTAGVKLLENGEIEVRGGIKLPQRFQVVPKLFSIVNKPLITIPPIHIPLFGIPLGVATIGIEAVIKPRLTADVQIGPGDLTNVQAEIVYNPTHPDDMTITGGADFEFIAEAGITAGVDFGISASIAIASLTGGINLSAYIKAAAQQPVFHADIKYSPKTGFELNGDVKALVKAILGFKGDLYAEASIGIWPLDYTKRWEWPIFKKEIDTGLQIGFEFPFSYKDGKADVTFENLKFSYPSLDNITSKVKEQIVNPIADKF